MTHVSYSTHTSGYQSFQNGFNRPIVSCCPNPSEREIPKTIGTTGQFPREQGFGTTAAKVRDGDFTSRGTTLGVRSDRKALDFRGAPFAPAEAGRGPRAALARVRIGARLSATCAVRSRSYVSRRAAPAHPHCSDSAAGQRSGSRSRPSSCRAAHWPRSTSAELVQMRGTARP